MNNVPLIDELRAIRQRLAEEQDLDVARYAAMLRKVGEGRPGAYVSEPFLPPVPQEKNGLADANEGTRNDQEKNQTYPAGWDEARVRKLAEHYDHQTEGEQVAEHEAAFRAEGQTVMVVPTELVPEIVKLISKKRPA